MEPGGTLWVDRMDHDKWGDWIPHMVVEDDIYEIYYAGGQVRGGGRDLHNQMAEAVGMSPQEFFDLTAQLRVPGGYDPDARIEQLDGDGVDAAVLYPSQAMFFGPVDPISAFQNVEFVTDCIRAYNDWISEFCSAYPTRLFAVGGVPLQAPELAVAEAERAVNKLGLRGIFIRPSAYVDELPLNHSVYDPFWAACQDLDVAVGLHPGVHVDTPGACRKFQLVAPSENMSVTNMAMSEIHGGSGLGQAVGNMVDMTVSLGRLLMGGVCERFPNLRILVLESGGGWVPSLLERMDEQVEAFPLEKRWLSMLPSEYFKRQCWISFDPGERTPGALGPIAGYDRFIWASDFPHNDAKYPGVVDELREHNGDLPDAARRAFFGLNALDMYGISIPSA
jgi:predicted TIM-barrel fold metal-dependent hydrolase